jgi:RNA polymerase sigma-70 factor (sigma-E family)
LEPLMSWSGAQSEPRDQNSPAAFGQVELLSFDGAATRRDRYADRARGDVDFDAFVRARWSSLFRFGWALTGSDAAAADLVQDALERTLLSWSRMTGDPEGYVRRVMVTRNISVWRRLRRERLTPDIPDRTAVESETGLHGTVWQALLQLPPRQRMVIALRYYEDLSENEIADVLGVSTGTVKSQASRALDKLRARLGDRDLLDDEGEVW